MQVISFHIDWVVIVASPLVAALWFVLTYSVTSAVTGGRQPTFKVKAFLLFGFLFVWGAGYTMSFTATFGLSPQTLWISLPTWGVLVAVFAWWRYRRAQRQPNAASEPPPQSG